MTDNRFYDLHGPFSLADLISEIDVAPPDQPYLDEMISGVAGLAQSKPGQISFLTSKRYKDDLKTAKATACLVSENAADLVGAAHIVPIISKTPRAHFARIVERFIRPKTWTETGAEPHIAASAKCHPTTVIGAGAEIGENALIGPYVVIGPGVKIGAGTRIESHVSIECAELGEHCLIKSGACIGSEGFGMDGDERGIVALPHVGRVIIGNHVRIGAQSTVDRGFLGDTVLGDHVKIDNLVQIAHNVQIGAGSMLAGRVGISGSCIIGKNVRMGGAVGLADHITVGDNAQIAAAAGVMHNIPEGEVWSGAPAMPIRDHMRLISATRKLGQKKFK